MLPRQNNQSALRRTTIKPQVSVIRSPVLKQPIVTQPHALARNTLRNVQKPQIIQPQKVEIQNVRSLKSLPPIVQTKNLRNVLSNRSKNESVAKQKPSPVVTSIYSELTQKQLERIKDLKNVGTGKYFAIIGNGPSLLNIDTSILKSFPNLFLCTINVPDKRCWPTPYWAFFDRSQYHRHKELYKTFSGTIFNSTGIREENENSIKFRHISGLGFSHDLSKGLYIGMSSVYAVIQIALYMNFQKVFVLGCDMNNQVDSNQTHFYGINPDVKPDQRKLRFEKEANWYNHMAENVSADIKSRIVFCSKGINTWQFMNSFHSVTPNETVEFIRGVITNAS